MNSFGLGLVLNFTDNASSGMRSASQTFNEMNGLASQLTDSADQAAYSIQTLAAAGASLTIVGDQMTQIGRSITGIFASLGQGVIDTGLEVQGFQRQLAALYGSNEAGKAKMEEIKQYALNSVFEVKDLMTSVSVMKAVGIEAMDDITSSSGKTTQKLMDYASDLAAMFPNMRNAYGTGVEAAMGALKEYIAEGNALSLKRSAGLDITGLLGEDKGKSIEERTRQVADLVEMMGIAGYTTSLMNTPTQQLSKMQDALYNGFAKIAESGVLQAYTDLLTIAADYVSDLVGNEEKMNTITEIVGGVLTSLITPLKSVLSYAIQLVDSFLSFAEAHPTLAKTILTVVAFSGIALIALGTLLKFAGSIFLLTSAFTQMSSLASKGISIFNILGRAAGIVFTKLTPLAAIAGLIYIAWKNNLFGIRDLVIKVFKDVGTILSVVFDAFSDNTLTEDMWVKARDLGILPFIESILLLKYYWGFFVDGFKKGFTSFFETINKIAAKFGVLDVNVFGMANSIGEVIAKLTGEDMQGGWEAIGEIVGGIVASLLIIIPLMKVMGGVFKVIKGVVTVVKDIWFVFTKVGPAVTKIGSAISKILTWGSRIVTFCTGTLWPILQTIGTAIMSGITAIAAALGLPVWAVVAIIAAVVALVAIIIIFRDQIAEFFVNLGKSIAEFFTNLWGTVTEWWNNLVNTIVQSPIFQAVAQIFNAIKTVVVSFVTNAIAVFKSFGNMVWNIVKGIGNVFVAVFNVIKAVVKNAIDIIVAIFRVLYETVRIIIYSVIWVFQQVFGFINDNIIQPFVSWITEKFQWLKDNVFAPIGEFFKGVWQSVVDFVTPIIQGIADVFTSVADKITEVFTGVRDFFTGIFDAIGEKATAFFDWIAEKLGFVADAINAIGSFFSNGINAAGDWLSGIGDNMQSMVGLSTGGYVKTTGIAVLHPNEVVVNDDITKKLGLFLDDYQERSAMTQNSPKTAVVNLSTETTPKGSVNSPVTPVVPVSNGTAVAQQSVPQPVQNDNRVIFEAGSVVIQIANATEAELEKAAEKLMKIIARKQQLQNMALRTV